MPIDLSTFISPALAFLGAAGAFYVKSSADSAAAAKVAKATDLLLVKIERIDTAVASAAISIRVAEERQANMAGDVTTLEQQMTSLVAYQHKLRHDWVDANSAILVKLTLAEDARDAVTAAAEELRVFTRPVRRR